MYINEREEDKAEEEMVSHLYYASPLSIILFNCMGAATAHQITSHPEKNVN